MALNAHGMRSLRWMAHSVLVGLTLIVAASATAQSASNREADYYQLVTIPLPEGVVLEVGGMAMLPDGRLAVATRRGEIWLIQNPTSGGQPGFHRFAQGLHEPLGLAYREGALYTAQRGELTRLRDTDGDGRADQYDTIYAWPLEGNYHEYSYGPLFRPDGQMLVTLNLGWIGHGASLSKWRGWMLDITSDGQMTPFATGMRSPAGFGFNAVGDLFYAENQGDWIGSGYITHVEPGDFVGNPAGLRWTSEPESPLALRPEDVPDTGQPMFEVAASLPALKPPAVWFPHTLMGISTSGILADTTGGAFGPFEGQLFVGDQGHSKVMRVFLEQVDGVYQGASFPFREGFASGVLRLAWGHDGSLFVGQTSRGWPATGRAPYALQRLVWTGRMPFEMETLRARPDGFEITFTQPVERATAAQLSSYAITSFTYKYHSTYGSPPINQQPATVRGVVLSDDGLRARLAVDGLREGYIHEVKASGVRNASGEPLLHDTAYYTLNRLPDGAPLEDLADAPTTTPQPRDARVTTRPSSPQPKHQTEMPAEWHGTADAVLTLQPVPGLRFDTESLTVQAGSHVQVIFANTDDMLHNVVIVAPGQADAVAAAAIELGLQGHEMHYVPDHPDVLFFTELLEPQTSQTIYFTAPTEPGDYTFVCTFPGHATTMRGTLRVLPQD